MAKDQDNMNENNMHEDNPFGDNSSENDPFNTDFGGEDNPFSSNTDEFSNIEGFNDLNTDDAGNFSNGLEMPVNPAEEPQPQGEQSTGKKGKKTKKVKRQNTKKQKVVGSKRSRPEHVDWIEGDYVIIAAMIMVLILFLGGNLMAFVMYGMSALSFILVFSLLSFVLLLVPAILWRERWFGYIPNLFDVLIALSLSLIIIGCIILVSVQSVKYGTEIKAKVSVVHPGSQITRTFDC